MNIHPNKKAKILFLFSDTGGGHRSSAMAIIEAIELEYPDRFQCRMVDVFRQYTPPPFDHAPEIYPPLTRMPGVWEASFRISNGRRRSTLVSNVAWPYVRFAFKRLIRENPSALYVSVHPLVNTPMLQALGNNPTPFMTVVTDMVSAHAFWFDRRADLVIVPTKEARGCGLDFGIDPDRLVITGQPVADRFCRQGMDKKILRNHLGWEHDLPVTLLVGGGDGMGPLEQTAVAINDQELETVLVIVTGRNTQLQKHLEKMRWNIPVRIYGFVQEMPDFMAAADILVTKAGPGTICEAFIAGLPMVLYSKVPGQEDGNVRYVVDNNAGVWAPQPQQVVSVLSKWLHNPMCLREVSQASRSLAVPHASRKIARLIAAQADAVPEPSLFL
ncbi:MAG: glycosyltransferase [Anaerolineaceae bacterium]|nr:glycosyltransferase [Anaerolineaceae bacterium]